MKTVVQSTTWDYPVHAQIVGVLQPKVMGSPAQSIGAIQPMVQAGETAFSNL